MSNKTPYSFVREPHINQCLNQCILIISNHDANLKHNLTLLNPQDLPKFKFENTYKEIEIYILLRHDTLERI